ncbi:MAG: nickel-dependent lactate racemase [Nitrososphaerota archaeon]
MRVELPYGEDVLEIEIDGCEVLRSRSMPAIRCIDEMLESALMNPISSPSLERLLGRARSILLIVPDNTRAFPARPLIPRLLEVARRINPMAEVRILVATGLHREVEKSELMSMLGREVLEEYEVINHRSSDDEQIVKLDARTSYGTPIQVNKLVLESDVVIGAGLIEPHFFAGYSGGRKIILPGVAGKEAIFRNHGFEMINDPRSRAGILEGNPIHMDMIEFMRMTKLDFIVNVTINDRKEITGVFTGDPVKAHLAGIEFLDRFVKIRVERPADIVITTNGGYPLDRDLYQAVKGMDTAAYVVRQNGVIIIASECRDGLGGHEEFLRIFQGADTPDDVLEFIRRNEPINDQWEAQVLARVLKRAKVILVSNYISDSVARSFMLERAKTIEEALEMSFSIIGSRDARVIAIPEGPYIIPIMRAGA